MSFWKGLFTLLGIDVLTGGHIFDGRKGRPGCGWVVIFIILFFPLWLVYKLFKWIFSK